MNFKWLSVPFSNKRRNVQVAQTWEVRWLGRTFWSNEICNLHPQLEAFLSEDEARKFAESLENAMKLLRYDGDGMYVKTGKAK